jgi:Dolichyl-phosphate-mannose-protein mannosyltransferase
LNSIQRFAKGLNWTVVRHGARAGLLVAIAAALLGWETRHTETSFADGLRYIHQAERIEAGSWHDSALRGADHPLHPLGIAMVHRLVGGDDPGSWQHAALLLSFCCTALLIVPTYLLAVELFGEGAAWLACLLVIVNPLSSYIVVNVLSESTFLLPWTFGVWSGIRFLRAGRPGWLVLALACGATAYLTRPEGLLLSAALLATLLTSAVFRATRLDWQRWWRLLAFVATGIAVLAGPYAALRGGLGTKPGIARVLGLAPHSNPRALEREVPLPADQKMVQTYWIATVRMLKVLRFAVTGPLIPFALLGMAVLARRRLCARASLFLAMILAASAVALVRLHATGGYCAIRHGLIPGMLLTVFAAGGLAYLTGKLTIPGRWLGQAQERACLPAPVWSILIVFLILSCGTRGMAAANSGPFAVYHDAGGWLARNVRASEQILDMTDWSLYLSGRTGYHFPDVYRAPADPATRWIVLRQPHVDGNWPYTPVLRDLIGSREPVAVIPLEPAAGQLQIWIYDRQQRESCQTIGRSDGSSSNEAPTQHPRRSGAILPRMERQIPPARSTDQGNGS